MITIWKSSTLSLTGGTVQSLGVCDIRPYGPERANLSGGSVGNLEARLRIEGEEHWTISEDASLSSLAAHGVIVAPGVVSKAYWALAAFDASEATVSGGGVSYLSAENSSTVNVSGGSVTSFASHHSSTVHLTNRSVSRLSSWDTSAVTVSGGTTDTLQAYDSSTMDVSGGTIRSLDAFDTSTVRVTGGTITQAVSRGAGFLNISGGTVTYLLAYDIRPNGPQRVSASGVNVDHLNTGLRLQGNEYLALSEEMSPSKMAPHGIQVSDDAVGSFTLSLSTYDTSRADIAGTSLFNIAAHDSSRVNVCGGAVRDLTPEDTSVITLSSGSISDLHARGASSTTVVGGSMINLSAYDTSTVALGGGTVNALWASDSCSVSISGGSLLSLGANGSSTVVFHGRDFVLGSGLTRDGDRILGKGRLSGEWSDGTSWTVNIQSHASGATILAVPEPATLWLLALGLGAMMRHRRGIRARHAIR